MITVVCYDSQVRQIRTALSSKSLSEVNVETLANVQGNFNLTSSILASVSIMLDIKEG